VCFVWALNKQYVIFMDIENNVCDFYIDIEKIARDFDGC
jgi:hypothetical protein